MSLISINGTLCESGELGFPINDAAYLYGAGCFETIRIVQGTPHLWDEHLSRLTQTAAFLRIDIPFSHKELRHQLIALLQNTGQLNAVCNLYLSAGDRTPRFSSYETPKVIMMIRPIPLPSTPVNCVVQTELTPRNLYSAHKLMAYLPSVLEQQRSGDKTPLLSASTGDLYETPTSSILGFKDKTVFLNSSKFVLPSVTAPYCADLLSHQGYTCITHPFTLDDLTTFNDICLVNALGITLINTIEGYPHLTSGVHSHLLSTLF